MNLFLPLAPNKLAIKSGLLTIADKTARRQLPHNKLSCSLGRHFSISMTPELTRQVPTYQTYHPPRLHDKVAIVTGASSGLGRAIALQYASHGTRLVVCADLKAEPRAGGVEEEMLSTHELINTTYGDGRAVFARADVNNTEQVTAMVQTAVEDGGRIDMCVL